MGLLLGLGVVVFITFGLIAVAWIIERSVRLKSAVFLIGSLVAFAVANLLAFSGAFGMSYCDSESCNSTFANVAAAILLAVPSTVALMLLDKTEKRRQWSANE